MQAQRVKRNAQKGVHPHWLEKPDVTGQFSAMEHAILFADGEASSGEVSGSCAHRNSSGKPGMFSKILKGYHACGEHLQLKSIFNLA